MKKLNIFKRYNSKTECIRMHLDRIKHVVEHGYDYFSYSSAPIQTQKDVEKVCDYIVYNIKTMSLDKMIKQLKKDVFDLDINLSEYFAFQYLVDAMLSTGTYMKVEYEKGDYFLYYAIIHFVMEIINLIKFNTLNRNIVGVDIKSNKIKYNNCRMMFDTIASAIRCPEDIRLMETTIESLEAKYDESLGICYNMQDKVKRVSQISDRLDDTIRQFRSSIILTDICRQMTGIDFVVPNLEMLRFTLEQNVCASTKAELLRNRKKTTPSSGVLLKNKDSSCIFKEVIIGDYAFCIYSYKHNIIENTCIAPIDITACMPDFAAEVVMMIYNYYGIDTDDESNKNVERLSPHMWKDRKKNYEGHEEDRHYFEKEIDPYIRKAEHCSDRAKKLAKEAHINLPEGYTFVSKHVRHYNKDLIEE